MNGSQVFANRLVLLVTHPPSIFFFEGVVFVLFVRVLSELVPAVQEQIVQGVCCESREERSGCGGDQEQQVVEQCRTHKPVVMVKRHGWHCNGGRWVVVA